MHFLGVNHPGLSVLLDEGEMEGDTIRCPWHGSRFCLTDGAVVEGPATFPERLYDVRVREGKIEVRAAK